MQERKGRAASWILDRESSVTASPSPIAQLPDEAVLEAGQGGIWPSNDELILCVRERAWSPRQGQNNHGSSAREAKFRDPQYELCFATAASPRRCPGSGILSRKWHEGSQRERQWPFRACIAGGPACVAPTWTGRSVAAHSGRLPPWCEGWQWCADASAAPFQVVDPGMLAAGAGSHPPFREGLPRLFPRNQYG